MTKETIRLHGLYLQDDSAGIKAASQASKAVEYLLNLKPDYVQDGGEKCAVSM